MKDPNQVIPDYDIGSDEVEGLARYSCEQEHFQKLNPICSVCGLSTAGPSIWEIQEHQEMKELPKEFDGR